jgi:hypothetical protein
MAQSFMSRDGTLGVVDSFIQNGCIDKQGDKTYVIKRPGTTLQADLGTGTDPQGAVFYNGLVYAVYGDVLYRTGAGANIGADGSAWTQAPVPAWYGRAFFTATVFQNRIYVIGGEAAQLRADVSYSEDGFVWSQNASGAPFGHRQGHGTVVFNNQMFLMGGFQNDATTTAIMGDVWVSSDGATWTLVTAAAAWGARLNFSLVAANNGMYLYGGQLADTTMADDVWFSTDGNTWTNLTMAATGVGRDAANLFFFQNQLWIVGGYSDAAGTIPINDVASSPDGATWLVTGPIFPTGRAIMAGVVYNNQMWVIAGVDSTNVVTSEVWSSPDGITWSLVTAAAGFTARGGAQAVAFKTPTSVNAYRYDTMWLLGGNDGVTGDLQQVWYANLNSALALTYALNPAVSGQPYQFATFLNGTKLLIKNQSNFWVLESGTLTPVTDTNYPSQTVPGIVVLNSFAYVMTPDGTIRSCALDNPLLWPSLQFIVADYEDDPGIAIAKYFNYLVAFGQYTLQFFYDAGNPAPGTALAPYQSTNIKIGLSYAATLQGAKANLIWVAQTAERNWGVYMFNGISPEKVSTQWVDKAINVNLNSGIHSWVTGAEGHTFYVLQFFSTSNYALVYDIDTKQWHIWISADLTTAFPYSYAVTEFFSTGDLWLGTGNLGGQIFKTSFEFYDDDGTPFDLRAQTDKIDADSLQRKFWGQADFVADTNSSTVTLDVSDDDYASWVTWGVFDLTKMRPMLNRGGSSRRRAFRATQTDSQPARWEALELTVSQGES